MRCVRGDDPEFASYLRIEKRALAGDGRRVGEAELAHGIVEELGLLEVAGVDRLPG
ncbi:MAG: hypothetical protein ABW012_03075 [Gaiellaceae bacterium]